MNAAAEACGLSLVDLASRGCRPLEQQAGFAVLHGRPDLGHQALGLIIRNVEAFERIALFLGVMPACVQDLTTNQQFQPAHLGQQMLGIVAIWPPRVRCHGVTSKEMLFVLRPSTITVTCTGPGATPPGT